MRNGIIVTGAGSGVGEAFARQFPKRDDVDLIGGRRADKLQAVGDAIGARNVVPGNLLEQSAARETLMASRGRVTALFNAINLDTHPVEAEREPLLEASNQLLIDFLEQLKQNSPDDPGLLLDINSVTQYFARENKRALGFPYMRMKMMQADIISAARNDLMAAGIEVVAASPGFIRTDMVSHVESDDDAIKLTNMFGKRMKNIPGHPNGIEQDRVFQRNEVATPLAALVNFYLANGEIPPQYREWLMAHSSHLQFAA